MKPCGDNGDRLESTRAVHGMAALAVLMMLASCSGKSVYPTRDGGMDTRREGGLVNINGEFNKCPDLVLVASPTRAPVGTSIDVSAHASDADKDPLIYLWEADMGSFANPKASETTYLCASAGVRMISVTVSDGACDPKQALTITCVVSDGGTADGTTGDGGAGDRGPVDTAVDRPMPTDMAVAIDVPVDRGTTGSGGSTGSGGTTGSGGSTGSGGTTGSGGSTGSGGTTGSGGMTGSGGSTGSGGGSGAMFEPSHPNAACNACTSAECNPMTEGCQLFTDAAKRQACVALYACIRASNCSMDGNPIPCWCGTAPATGACISAAGSANGPCASQFAAAADTQDPAVINERFVNPMFPIGAAVNLEACRGSFCVDQCP